MTGFYGITSFMVGGTLGALKLGEVLGASYAERFSKKWPSHMRKSCARNEIAVYEKAGSSESQRCVLLIHGMGNSSVSLIRLGDEIAKVTRFPVIRYDRPGYGSSRFCTDEPYSVTQSVDELVEIIRWLHKRCYRVTIIGHSYGGLLAHLALRMLGEPEWCDAVLIEPTHLREAVRDSKRILGVALGVENLRNRYLLSLFGGELLDASIGPHALDGQHYPYIDAVRRERRSSRCVRATKREFSALAQLLFDGALIQVPQASASIRVVSSARSVEDSRQRDLFAAYVCVPEGLIVLRETSHDTITLDRHTVERIVQLVRSGDANAA